MTQRHKRRIFIYNQRMALRRHAGGQHMLDEKDTGTNAVSHIITAQLLILLRQCKRVKVAKMVLTIRFIRKTYMELFSDQFTCVVGHIRAIAQRAVCIGLYSRCISNLLHLLRA